MAFQSEAPAQERSEPPPALPAPTHLVEMKDTAESIAGPKAADPRKAGPAKGRAKTASESKQPKATAAKVKGPKVKGSKRKRKTGQ
jgi:hypothetical protein